MKARKALATLSGVCLLLWAAAPYASAQESTANKKSFLTVTQPVAIPGQVLQPGRYVIQVQQPGQNRDVVQIFDESGNQLQGTAIAIHNSQLQPMGDSQLSFWATMPNQPAMVQAWFYPGDNYGKQFVYPRAQAEQIAKLNNVTVPALASENPADLTNAQIIQVSPSTTGNASTSSCGCGASNLSGNAAYSGNTGMNAQPSVSGNVGLNGQPSVSGNAGINANAGVNNEEAQESGNASNQTLNNQSSVSGNASAPGACAQSSGSVSTTSPDTRGNASVPSGQSDQNLSRPCASAPMSSQSQGTTGNAGASQSTSGNAGTCSQGR